VRKIAVVRANALGDLVFALPALSALRSAYPEARITLLGRSLHEAVFNERPSPVDEIVRLPRLPVVAPDGEGDPAAFFERMRAERFDLAVQLHGGGRESNPVVKALGAGTTVGLCAADAVALDRCVPYVYYQHEVVRYLEVVGLVGATPVELEPRLAVTAADVAASRSVVAETRRPTAILHPAATDHRRRWPAEGFASVGDAAAAAGLSVVLIGLESEKEATAAVTAAMRHPVLDLTGRLDLPALIGLLSRAAVVVGNDSGPIHLAAAVGARTVGVYWCGNMINGAPLTRTRHRQAIAWAIRCPVCGVDNARERCNHRDSFVAEVPAEEVIGHVMDLVSEAKQAPLGVSA
jgi:ADP-heptose:LPS heptosyltransferase